MKEPKRWPMDNRTWLLLLVKTHGSFALTKFSQVVGVSSFSAKVHLGSFNPVDP